MSRAGRGDDLQFAPRALLDVLVKHEVRFVVIGGIAGNAHGSTTATLDLDVCYARDGANLQALAAALRELDVTLRGAPPGVPFQVDDRSLRNGSNFTFDTELGKLDCLAEASGYTFEVLSPNAELADLGGIEVLVASLDDLIRMRRAAGRLKDLVEVENLSKLREVREAHGLYRLEDRLLT